jgi:hypothetical protein
MTTTAQLDALIDELTVDAYGDDEHLTGFLTGAEEALRRGDETYEVGLADLVFARDSQLGIVVAAYRRWQGREPHDQ